MIKSIIGLILSTTALARLDFLVMGDWGGVGIPPYTSPFEQATAKGMGKQATELNATFSLALGDNFYWKGIPTDEHDMRFKHTFEDVFSASSLQAPRFTFHVLAGNHDHKGNITAQTAYSQLSKRWSFPQLWYTFNKTDSETNATVQFVMIDTVILSGASDILNEKGEIIRELPGSQLTGPDQEWKVEAATQMEWLEATLAASKADYLIVAGHYPVWSIAEHGPTAYLVKNLKPLLEKYKVSAYLNGHDHCQEYIDEGTGVQYHVIGSADISQPSTKHEDDVPPNSLKWHNGIADGGFGSVRISKEGMVITHRSGAGKEQYSAPAIQPRKLTSELILQ